VGQVPYDLAGKTVWVAGHRGMVGSAVARRLASESCTVIDTGTARVDFRRQADVEAWVGNAKPEVVVLAAAKVGGILANDTYPAEFLYDNLAIETNIIEAAHRAGVEKLLLLGSSCIYPRMAPQPIAEDALLTGPLEPTNQWYAIAKIAGIMLCQAYRRQYGADFISCMPTNLYGPGDNFDLKASHVIPALMRRIDEAKRSGAATVEIWGTGKPLREFLHVDDLADAAVFLLKSYSGEDHVNVGTGTDVTIAELARLIAEVVGYEGAFAFDTSKPDGTPRKLLDVGRLTGLGWQARTDLRDGLAGTYAWFLEHAGTDLRL
jgi:GDP-L-fucose synthase